MDRSLLDEEAIFHAARQIESTDARARYLDQVCGSSQSLRQGVDLLLRYAEEDPDFLESPALDFPPAMADDDASLTHEAHPTQIGPYQLLEWIGEGGMGVVYRAEQTQPVHRVVALKLIRPGMESSLVVARFEAEFQALERMDHPGIARVLDGGVSAAGRPYVVMELVEGSPINAYCDQHGLTIRQRLELFVLVCRAVQHAHQKGIIHRDLKPGNVLVTVQDGEPLPKVIDFGIAKATGASLSDRPVTTAVAQFLGTPAYMSPEQAHLGRSDVDTRSDIYSLGVLLHELLTGTTPFDAERLRKMPLDELCRTIREQEPLKPSARLSSLADAERLASAGRRHTRPRQLVRALRGELDWIVLKCLDKDRGRRYETASALAGDLARFLADLPVLAGPPSNWYRFGKFARRHRASLGAASVAGLSLVIGLFVSTWQAFEARQARSAMATALTRSEASRQQAERSRQQAETSRQQAEQARRQAERARTQAEAISELLFRAFQRPDPGVDGKDVKIADVLDQAVAQLDKGFAGSKATEGALLAALGRAYLGLGLSPKSVNVFQKARAAIEAGLGPDHPETITTRNNLGVAQLEAGSYAEAITHFQAVLENRVARLGPDHPETLVTRNNLAAAYRLNGRSADAITQLEVVRQQQQSTLGPDHPETLATSNNLSRAYSVAGRLPEAIALLEPTLQLMQTRLGPDHPNTLSTSIALALAYQGTDRNHEAIALYRDILPLMDAKLGSGHPHTLVGRNNLALALQNVGRTPEAIDLLETVRQQELDRLGPDHPNTLRTRNNLGMAYLDAGQTSEAITLLQETLQRTEAKLGPEHLHTLATRDNLALAYERKARWADAEPLRRSLLAAWQRVTAPRSPQVSAQQDRLAENLLNQARWADAEPLLRQSLLARLDSSPDAWQVFHCLSLLGGSLLGQERYDEAEPLLKQAYEGLNARVATMPFRDRDKVSAAARRVVRLYVQWSKPELAQRWREKTNMPELPPEVFARPE